MLKCPSCRAELALVEAVPTSLVAQTFAIACPACGDRAVATARERERDDAELVILTGHVARRALRDAVAERTKLDVFLAVAGAALIAGIGPALLFAGRTAVGMDMVGLFFGLGMITLLAFIVFAGSWLRDRARVARLPVADLVWRKPPEGYRG